MRNLYNKFLEQKSHRKTQSLLAKLEHVYSLTQIIEVINLLNGIIQKIIYPDNEKQKLVLSHNI